MIPYKEDFAHIDIPILSTTGYYDDGQRGAMYYYPEHLKYKPDAEHYLLIGPYDHWGAQSASSTNLRGKLFQKQGKKGLIASLAILITMSASST